MAIKITVNDLGNYNTKALDVDTNKKICFSSKTSKDYESTPELFNWVKYEEGITYFEKGNFSMENVKTNKDFTNQLLYSMAKLYDEEEIETNLCLLLPTQQMTIENKTKYLNLKDKTFEYECRANGNVGKRKLTIKDVMVLPEGYVTFFSLPKELQTKSILIIDIGGRTSNYCSFINGILEVNKTSNIGSLDFYERIRLQNSSKQCDLKDIERFIKSKYVIVHKKDYIRFYNDIIEDVQSHGCILDHFDNIIFSGGGSSLLNIDCVKEKIPQKAKVLDNNLYSNVIGAGVVAKMKWGDDNGKAEGNRKAE